MPDHKLTILLTLAIALCFVSCHNKTKEPDTSSEYNEARNIILGINSQQQKLYQQFSTKNERAKKYKEFCDDSLITITGYGNFLYNAADASNDVVDGYADTIHDVDLKIYDNTAILTGKAKMFQLIKSDTLYEDIWISKVFIKVDGKWKMVLRNSGPLGTNYRTPVKVEVVKLKRFEGIYGLPMDAADTFRVEGDHLFQFGINNLKIQYYPLNDSTFFTKNDLSTIIFKRNSNSEVSHFEWMLPNGQIVEIPRVKK